MTPPAAQRAVAIVHVAMFDAVNAIEPRYRPYLVQLPAAAATSKEAAATAAAGVALQRLVPQVEKEIMAALAAYLATIADGDAKEGGVKLGTAVAERILEARADDGANAADTYRPKTRPGVYVPTPITVGSTWPNLKPFAMTSPAQFRPQPPIALERRAMGRRLQRDQGSRRQDQQQALGATDRGRPLLADHRAAEHRSDRAPAGGGETR